MKKEHIFLFLLLFMSCKIKNDPRDQYSLLFYNACVGTILNGYVNEFSSGDITYLSNQTYRDFIIEKSTISAGFKNGATPFLQANLSSGIHKYSIFALGSNSSPQIKIVPDELTVPVLNVSGTNSYNAASIRVIHPPDTFKLGLYVGGYLIASGNSTNMPTNFVNIPSGNYDVFIKNEAGTITYNTLTNQNFDSGKIYTLVLAGNSPYQVGKISHK